VTNQLLYGKSAIVFGATGNLGRQIVLAFQAHGARVHASALRPDALSDITDLASVQRVDALDEQEVETYVAHVASQEGGIDVVINAATTNPAEYGHGLAATEVTLEQFMIPLRTATATQFVTAKAAFSHMRDKRRGAIVFLTSTLAKVGSPWSPALSASHAGTEGLMRSLANEWGPEGVRVLGVRAEAMPESPAIKHTFTAMGRQMGLTFDEMAEYITQNRTALKRLPPASEVAGAVVLAASDLAANMTGTIVNYSGGHILD